MWIEWVKIEFLFVCSELWPNTKRKCLSKFRSISVVYWAKLRPKLNIGLLLFQHYVTTSLLQIGIETYFSHHRLQIFKIKMCDKEKKNILHINRISWCCWYVDIYKVVSIKIEWVKQISITIMKAYSNHNMSCLMCTAYAINY